MSDFDEKLDPFDIMQRYRTDGSCEPTIRKALRLLAAVESGDWKVVPIKATAENGMKYKMIGELRYNRTYTDDDGEEHDIKFELTWSETKEVYDKLLQAAPEWDQ